MNTSHAIAKELTRIAKSIIAYREAVKKEYLHSGTDLEIRMYEKPVEDEIDADKLSDIEENSNWMNSQMPQGRTVCFFDKKFLIKQGLFQYIVYADNYNGIEDVLKNNGFICID